MLDLAGGGAERCMLNLGERFIAQSHRVELVVERWRGAYCEFLPPGLEVTVLERYGRRRALGLLLRGWPRDAWAILAPRLLGRRARLSLSYLLPLADWLRRRRPDVVITALRYTPFNAVWARRLAGVDSAVVATEHNMFSPRLREHPRASPNDRHLRLLRTLMRRHYPRLDGVVAVSQGVADDLANVLGMPGHAIETIYNPTINAAIHGLALHTPAHPWFVDDGPPVILAAGRLVTVKNFAGLIDAFAQVRETHDLRLVIIGEGPERFNLTRRATRLGVDAYLDMPGWIDDPYSLMRRARLFVLSSTREGLGGVLIEAMACGCPVVATDCPSGPREILDGGRYGTLVPVGDAAALAQGILTALGRDTPAQIAEWIDRFSVEHSAERYLDLSRRAIARRRARPG